MKSLVVDIDDTISFTNNRDFANAEPNIPLIKKLNAFFDSGVEIHYVTARGNLSCKTREEAEEKYRDQILEYFAKHGVKYTSLSFQKKLADYYIDDKAIRPDEFLKLDVTVLSGGLSGSTIERHDNLVYKTCSNAFDYVNWYNHVMKYNDKPFDVPKLHSLVGQTICMDFIVDAFDYNKDNYLYATEEGIEKIIEFFEDKPSIYSAKFETYIERVKNHLDIYNPEYSKFVLDELSKHSDFYDENSSLCHGDFSYDNIIVGLKDHHIYETGDVRKYYLIDANLPPRVYESWLLDVSKFLVSCDRFGEDVKKDYLSLCKKYHSNKYIQLLEITHWIRMRKYHNDKDFVDMMIESAIKEYKNG